MLKLRISKQLDQSLSLIKTVTESPPRTEKEYSKNQYMNLKIYITY